MTDGSAASEGPFSAVYLWLAALLVAACAGAVAIHFLRRFISRSGTTPADGFSLQDLRELHAQGRLSDEEFERAKASIIGRARDRATDGDADASELKSDSRPLDDR